MATGRRPPDRPQRRTIALDFAAPAACHCGMSAAVVQKLLELLDLEPIEVNLFRGYSPANGPKRVFGGQVVAQSLVAACRTVDGERAPHSLHGYFLLAGDPTIPIVYEVERIRDGRSFTTRRVKAIQRGQAIFSMSASYHVEEPGLEHQTPMPDVPHPQGLGPDPASRAQILAAMPEAAQRYYQRERPIDLRPVELGRYMGEKRPDGRFHVWFRAAAPLPDDPTVHRCILAYASDMMLLDTALATHGRTLLEPSFMAASLDHAVWFHRPFRADEWLLYAQDGPNLHGSRGLARGLIYAADGSLVASTAQEGLIRERRGAAQR